MKKVLLIVIVLLLCCCVISAIGIGLFGNFTANGNCVYVGPYATKTGACLTNGSSSSSSSSNSSSSTSDNSSSSISSTSSSSTNTTGTTQYNGKNASTFTFNYANGFTLSDSSSLATTPLFVYSHNPSTIAQGTFNDNLNIVSQSEVSDMDADLCKQYATSVTNGLTSQFTVDKNSIGSQVIDLPNFTSVCRTNWNAQLRGISFSQEQFVIGDKKSNTTYIITVSTSQNSSYLNSFEDTVKSFQTK